MRKRDFLSNALEFFAGSLLFERFLRAETGPTEDDSETSGDEDTVVLTIELRE